MNKMKTFRKILRSFTETPKERAIRMTVNSMYADHVNYPQLKLPEMQAFRLKELMRLVN